MPSAHLCMCRRLPRCHLGSPKRLPIAASAHFAPRRAGPCMSHRSGLRCNGLTRADLPTARMSARGVPRQPIQATFGSGPPRELAPTGLRPGFPSLPAFPPPTPPGGDGYSVRWPHYSRRRRSVSMLQTERYISRTAAISAASLASSSRPSMRTPVQTSSANAPTWRSALAAFSARMPPAR
jgi:hypothetical protein